MDAQPATGAELFDLIAAVEARFRALGARLPEQAAPVERWAGVLFRVGERQLLAPLDQVAEVLGVPGDITAVPGTKTWVLGVANHRGTLLPVFDLAALTQGVAPVRRDTDRILVVSQDGLPCGLVASAVVGIRHFDATRGLTELPGGLGVLRPFVLAAFPLAGESVPVIALDRLLADPLMSLASA
jgi:twitching motility protein PilI